jgi:hypothetical protein
MTDERPAADAEIPKRDRWGRHSDGLTHKQRRFVEEFLVDMNATQAAIRAGYSPKSASDIGDENKRKPAIVDAICKALAKRSEETAINAKWVLARLADAEGRAGKSKKTLGHQLRALELIGKHVDVQAFRSQFGISNPDGSPLDERWDFSRLTDEEFTEFGRLLRKLTAGDRGPHEPTGDVDAVAGGDTAPLALGNGSGAPAQGEGSGGA